MGKKAIFFALDNSGSMEDNNKANELRMSMTLLIDQYAEFIEGEGNQLDLAICVWGDEADTLVWRNVSLAGLSGAKASLDRLNAESGGTNFASFAPDARAFFEETLDSPYESRTLIFLTDGDPTPASTADTAASILADLLDRANPPFTQLNATEVDCYAANIELGSTIHTAKLDNTGRDGVPVIAGNTRALTAYLRAITIPVGPSRLWGWPVQWADGFEEERAFRTEIIVSRDGTEQRIGQRINPRVNYEFTSVLTDASLRTAIARILRNQGGIFYVPYPREPGVLATPLTGASLNFDLVGTVPGWLEPGIYAVFESPSGQMALGVVIEISGSRVNLAAPLGTTMPAGSLVRLGVSGRFDGASEFNMLTNTKATATTTFLGDPVETPHPVFGPAPVTLDGTEFFNMKPNWRNGAEVTFEQPIELLDLNRGAVDAFFPVEFSARAVKLTYVARNAAELDRIFGLFYRSSGRRKRFLMPLWVDEIRPFGTALNGSTSFTVRGDDLATTHRELDTHKRLLVRRKRGLADLILTVDSMSIDGAGNSVVNLTAPVTDDIIEQEIASVNWIMPVRLASDRLSVNWRTDGVAEITLTFMTLENEA